MHKHHLKETRTFIPYSCWKRKNVVSNNLTSGWHSLKQLGEYLGLPPHSKMSYQVRVGRCNDWSPCIVHHVESRSWILTERGSGWEAASVTWHPAIKTSWNVTQKNIQTITQTGKQDVMFLSVMIFNYLKKYSGGKTIFCPILWMLFSLQKCDCYNSLTFWMYLNTIMFC